MSEVRGTLIFIGETQVVGNNFQKREFAVETNENYPQKLLFTLFKDNCSKLDSLSEGSVVSLKYNVKGRSWQDNSGVTKYANTLECWFVKQENPY